MNATQKARTLRSVQTNAEIKFWNRVRNRKTGLKFVRQKPITFSRLGKSHVFYADFYCKEKYLVVEIDGKVHENQKEHDDYRDYVMKNLGINVVRITNEEVFNNIDGCINKILII